MQLSSALTPLQVKSKKRELGFIIEDGPIVQDSINDLRPCSWLMKSSFIPKEEDHHV